MTSTTCRRTAVDGPAHGAATVAGAARPLRTRLASLISLAAVAGTVLAVPVASAQVGFTRASIDGQSLTLVYPTAEPSRPTRLGPFTLDVALDAAPAAGVRRLVVLSHGSGGNPLSDHELAATLARAGLVVAQPQHTGDHHGDSSLAGPASWERRPREISAAIDVLARDPRWAPRLALDRVGVHGMSAGGVGALALAGAQWRTLDLIRHCNRVGEADVGFCFNGLPTREAQAERRARFESARSVPEAFLPAALKTWHGGRTPQGASGAAAETRPDERVAAVTLAVPVGAIFDAESLARIRVPVGVVSAGNDTMLPGTLHAEHVLRECSACMRLAHLADAAHMDLLAPWPESVAREVAAAHPRGAEPAAGFDPAARRAAFAQIARFHVERLGRAGTEP